LTGAGGSHRCASRRREIDAVMVAAGQRSVRQHARPERRRDTGRTDRQHQHGIPRGQCRCV